MYTVAVDPSISENDNKLIVPTGKEEGLHDG